MKLKSIDKEERPREKLINKGVKSLSNSELLAIMLDYGTKEESVLDLSNRLIKEYGFSRLFYSSYSELKQIKGIKEAKACKLMALFEIARRIGEDSKRNITLNFPEDVFNYVKNDYLFYNIEMVSVIYIDKLCRVIGKKQFESNDSLKTIFPIKDIVAEALNNKAFGLFVVHNHPSGDLKPSKEDINTTKMLKNILDNLNIMLMDHIIIGKDNYLSIFNKISLM